MSLLLCLTSGVAKEKRSSNGSSKSSKSSAPDLSEGLLGTNAPIRTFHIDVTSNELAALQKDVRAYVRGTVTEGSNVFHNVGVHLKGMGSFQPLDKKPSFVAKFDRYVPGQKYFSLSKIALNNASQDPTYLAEYMATWMFRDANVPSPRVGHARVTFNGRDLGLYVCIESVNKEFLKRWFHDHNGNLYENYVKDIDSPMDQDNGIENSQADVKRLLRAAQLSDPAARWTNLNAVLDVDRYVSHLVCEVFTSHRDGYALNRNNYRIYDDPATGRFTFIGHGLDWGFADAGISMQVPQNSIITRAVLTTPQGSSLYRERARLLFTNVFKLDVMTNRVNCAVARLVAYSRDTNEAKQFINNGNEMRGRIINRRRNIESQFAAESMPHPNVGSSSNTPPKK